MVEIDRQLRADGFASGLAPALRRAFLACPRHLFVHRFRLTAGEPARNASDEAGLMAHVGAIYLDEILIHVDAKGRNLPSTNSQPSFIARLLTLLDPRPGQRVLEIGSGGGWLAALVGRLVGPTGRVVGVEIIQDLAMEARVNLLAAGATNVDIIVGDGASGYAEGAPYDRVIVTAGTWDIPTAIFAQLREDGLLVAPIRIKGPGEDVVLLRRRGKGFIAEAALFAYFVPLTGSRGGGGEPIRLETLPFWPEIRGCAVLCVPATFGGSFAHTFGFRTSAFRSFLTKTEPRFAMLQGSADGAFAVIDGATRSVAVWEPRRIVGFGAPNAIVALLESYRRWTAMLMPTVEAFDLFVHPGKAVPSAPSPRGWLECRGDAVLAWTLKSAAEESAMAATMLGPRKKDGRGDH